MLNWDEDGEKLFETGVDHGVLFPKKDDGTYDKGVAWNGLTAFNETPSGAEETKLYADNTKYLSLRSVEELGATIEAYMYPKEFAECDGSAEVAPGVFIGQQARKAFAFACRTKVGNDIKGDDFGYNIILFMDAKLLLLRELMQQLMIAQKLSLSLGKLLQLLLQLLVIKLLLISQSIPPNSAQRMQQ